jgi:C1A family cysteine protease
MKFAALFLLAVPAFAESSAELIEQRNAENPFATFSVDALTSQNVGGCFNAPSPPQLAASAKRSADTFSFSEEELRIARDEKVSIDWVKSGAVGPIQQQHPYGTCWAFSMVAVTEAVNVIQGKNPYQKLSEQMVVSCVPETACGDNGDVLWSW